MIQRLHSTDIWERVTDRAFDLMNLDQEPEDLDRRDQVVRRSLPNQGEEAAVYQFRKLGMGMSHAFAVRQSDASGQPVKVEFAYGWCYLGSEHYETTAGQLRQEPDGTWSGEVAVSIPGVGYNQGSAVFAQPGEPALAIFPRELTEQLDRMGQEIGGTSSALVPLSPEQAGNMAHVLAQHLELEWNLKG
jgi:hypothetical protein